MANKGVMTSIKEFFSGNSLRISASALAGTFYNRPIYSGNPIFDGTTVNRDLARKLYQNKDQTCPYGNVFARPIIDLSVNFIGLPSISSGDETIDDFIEKCIKDYWPEQLIELYRNTLRDSESWARIRTPFDSPLISQDELDRVIIEIVDPDRIAVYHDPVTNILVRAEVKHRVNIEQEAFSLENLQSNSNPTTRLHDIIEVITADSYKYFDLTTKEELTQLEQTNTWGFIPLVHFYNEYDSTMRSGQSDLEVVYPFLQAYDQLIKQSMKSHAYHSTPKVFFKLQDIGPFLAHNFPDSYDEDTGKFTGTINWTGKEIFFMDSEEEVGFLEAKSVLGESVSLLEFIFDSICVASETPEWAFMRVSGGVTTGNSTPQTLPFVNKIKRKRTGLEAPIQELVKMALLIYGYEPIKVGVSWPAVQVEDEAAKADAMTRLISGLEVANRAGVISKQTYRNTLKEYLPTMGENDVEQTQIDLEVQADLDQQILEAEKLAAIQIKVSASTVIGSNQGTPTPGGPNSIDTRTSRVNKDVTPQND